MDTKSSKMHVDSYGIKYWKISNGQLHNEYGPAIEYVDGSKEWHQYGKYHRLDGPASEWSDGDKYWYINSNFLEKEEFNSWILRIQKYYEV